MKLSQFKTPKITDVIGILDEIAPHNQFIKLICRYEKGFVLSCYFGGHKVLVQVCDVVIFGTKQRVRKQLDSSLLRAVLKKLQLPTSLPPIQDKVQTLLVFTIGS